MDTLRAFAVLELPPSASLSEAKEAYRVLAQVWHPDKHVHNPKLQLKASEKFKEISLAWSIVQEFYNGNVYNKSNKHEYHTNQEQQRTYNEEYERGVRDEAQRRARETSDRNQKVVETVGGSIIMILFIGVVLFILSVVVPFLGIPATVILIGGLIRHFSDK